MLTKQDLLLEAQQLDIDITMYRKATNILDLDVGSNEFDDFLDDISDPVYYHTIEENYETDENYYWIFDLQIDYPYCQTTIKVNTKDDFWGSLITAVERKKSILKTIKREGLNHEWTIAWQILHDRNRV